MMLVICTISFSVSHTQSNMFGNSQNVCTLISPDYLAFRPLVIDQRIFRWVGVSFSPVIEFVIPLSVMNIYHSDEALQCHQLKLTMYNAYAHVELRNRASLSVFVETFININYW